MVTTPYTPASRTDHHSRLVSFDREKRERRVISQSRGTSARRIATTDRLPSSASMSPDATADHCSVSGWFEHSKIMWWSYREKPPPCPPPGQPLIIEKRIPGFSAPRQGKTLVCLSSWSSGENFSDRWTLCGSSTKTSHDHLREILTSTTANASSDSQTGDLSTKWISSRSTTDADSSFSPGSSSSSSSTIRTGSTSSHLRSSTATANVVRPSAFNATTSASLCDTTS